MIQGKANATIGEPVNVGDIPERAGIVTEEDHGEPAELLARILAHMGHRIPLISKVEKRLEGKTLSSGIGSDMLALGAQLWIRNRPLIEKLAERAVVKMQENAALRKQEKAAQKAEREATQNGARAPMYQQEVAQ